MYNQKIILAIVESNDYTRELISSLSLGMSQVDSVILFKDIHQIIEKGRIGNSTVFLVGYALAVKNPSSVNKISAQGNRGMFILCSDDRQRKEAERVFFQNGMICVTVKSFRSELEKTISEIKAKTHGFDVSDREIRGKRILVADDDALYRNVIGNILKRAGTDFKIVESGNQAVMELLAGNFEYHCVVLDFHMDELNGIEAAKLINKINKEMPVLLISGDNSMKAEKASRRAGIDGYLTKPFDEDIFLEHILMVINKKRFSNRMNLG